ncbi:hypothetical protein AAVH_04156 [Aphelenchoides avenae]|nr:hypothetical protein AAVH_04156 [Aphelenchus avenae]
MSIHEKYSAVKWDSPKIDLLRELYAGAPLNMACLNHAGDLFPGHPTNWKRVPRPETFAGVYAKVRSADECPATNV